MSIDRPLPGETAYNGGMGRRFVAGGCALVGAALAVAGACSYLIIPSMQLSCFDHDALVLHFFDGRVRLFWFHSPVEPIVVEPEEDRPFVVVRSQADDSPALTEDLVGPPTPPTFRVPIRIGDRHAVLPIGGGWRIRIGPQPPTPLVFGRPLWRIESSFLRLPIWPIVIALMIPPVRDSIRQRRRWGRKKRNECLECGYNLRGNVSGLCSECGRAIAKNAGKAAP